MFAPRQPLSYGEWSSGLIRVIDNGGDHEASRLLLVSRESALVSLAFTAPEALAHRESAYKIRMFHMIKALGLNPRIRAALSLYFASFT